MPDTDRKQSSWRIRPWGWAVFVVCFFGLILALMVVLSKPSAAPKEGEPQAAVRTQGEAARLGQITNISTIAAANDPTSLLGRQVQLYQVKVIKKADNRIFWIGSSLDQAVLVMTLEVENGSRISMSSDIRVGQSVSVTGEVRENPGYEVIHKQLKLPADVENWLTTKKIYVYATDVVINTEPGQTPPSKTPQR